MKHLKKHSQKFHSERSSKTIIDHNLDRESTQNKDNNYEKETLTNENKNLVKSSTTPIIKKCRKSRKPKTQRNNHISGFVSRGKIIAKYKKIMSRIMLKSKLKMVLKSSKTKPEEPKIKMCDVMIRKMKIKPVCVKPCRVNSESPELLFNSCDLCDQKFSTEEHLKLHKQFCKDIYVIKFKCKEHLLTSELCSSLSFKLY
eukprot:GFUD01040461.1.p1 GENE.GFUD01040461.1~~GFUD01040461.1.p1  ORF type:complete len:226 (+),score=35.01 GFUD01040461.1:80-679(+)